MGISAWKWGFTCPCFHVGTIRCHTGIQNKMYPRFHMVIPIWKWGFNFVAPRFYMGITVWKRGLTAPHFHMVTIQSLTRFHLLPVII